MSCDPTEQKEHGKGIGSTQVDAGINQTVQNVLNALTDIPNSRGWAMGLTGLGIYALKALPAMPVALQIGTGIAAVASFILGIYVLPRHQEKRDEYDHALWTHADGKRFGKIKDYALNAIEHCFIKLHTKQVDVKKALDGLCQGQSWEEFVGRFSASKQASLLTSNFRDNVASSVYAQHGGSFAGDDTAEMLKTGFLTPDQVDEAHRFLFAEQVNWLPADAMRLDYLPEEARFYVDGDEQGQKTLRCQIPNFSESGKTYSQLKTTHVTFKIRKGRDGASDHIEDVWFGLHREPTPPIRIVTDTLLSKTEAIQRFGKHAVVKMDYQQPEKV